MRACLFRSSLAVLFSVMTCAAQAQIVSVYGTYSPVRVSGVHNGGSGSTAAGYSNTSFWASGVGGGATLGVLPIGPIHIGLDLRGSTRPGANGADLVLAGVKVGLKLPFLRVKPYVQGSGGYLGTRTVIALGETTGATETDHFAAYEILGGVDYKFLPFIDLRLVEVGGGKAYFLSGAGESGINYSPGLFTVNTGVVFHF